MTKLTGCRQLYALVPGIAAAWNYAEKSFSLMILWYIHLLHTKNGTTEY